MVINKKILLTASTLLLYSTTTIASLIELSPINEQLKVLINKTNIESTHKSVYFISLKNKNEPISKEHIDRIKQHGGILLINFPNKNSSEILSHYFGAGVKASMALVKVNSNETYNVIPIMEEDNKKKPKLISQIIDYLTLPSVTQEPLTLKLNNAEDPIKRYTVTVDLIGNNDEQNHQHHRVNVEVVHNTKTNAKVARFFTDGQGYYPAFLQEPTITKYLYPTYDAAHFRVQFPLQYSFSFGPKETSGNGPVFISQFSPENSTEDVFITSTTDISAQIGASIAGTGPEGNAGIGFNLSKSIRWGTEDYTTRVISDGNRKVVWNTNLNRVRGYSWNDYGKFVALKSYLNCYNDNFVPKNEWPAPASGYRPGYQYVIYPRDSNTETTTITAKASYTLANEFYMRFLCNWQDLPRVLKDRNDRGEPIFEETRIQKEVMADIEINWNDERLQP